MSVFTCTKLPIHSLLCVGLFKVKDKLLTLAEVMIISFILVKSLILVSILRPEELVSRNTVRKIQN